MLKLNFRQLLTQRPPRKRKNLQSKLKKVTYALSGMVVVNGWIVFLTS